MYMHKVKMTKTGCLERDKRSRICNTLYLREFADKKYLPDGK